MCTDRTFYARREFESRPRPKLFLAFFWPFLASPNENIAQNGAKKRFQNFRKTRGLNRQSPDYETSSLALSHPAIIENRAIFDILILHGFYTEKLTP